MNLGRNHYVVVCRLELPLGVALETVPLAFAGGHGLQTMAVGGRRLVAGGTLAPTAFFLCPQPFVGWALRSGRVEVGHRLVLLEDRCLPSSPRFLSLSAMASIDLWSSLFKSSMSRFILKISSPS